MPEGIDFEAILERASVKREISPRQMDEYYDRFPKIAAAAALRGGPTVDDMFGDLSRYEEQVADEVKEA